MDIEEKKRILAEDLFGLLASCKEFFLLQEAKRLYYAVG